MKNKNPLIIYIYIISRDEHGFSGPRPVKRCSVRLYPQLFVGGLMSYLCYLCLSNKYWLYESHDRWFI